MEELITGFWEFRMTKLSEQSREEINSLDKLLFEYCYTRNDGNEELAIEDGYNLQVMVHEICTVSTIYYLYRLLSVLAVSQVLAVFLAPFVTMM